MKLNFYMAPPLKDLRLSIPPITQKIDKLFFGRSYPILWEIWISPLYSIWLCVLPPFGGQNHSHIIYVYNFCHEFARSTRFCKFKAQRKQPWASYFFSRGGRFSICKGVTLDLSRYFCWGSSPIRQHIFSQIVSTGQKWANNKSERSEFNSIQKPRRKMREKRILLRVQA